VTEYRPQELDKKWQDVWTATRAFEVDIDSSRPKFYCLEMFAYPSGHAHVGHVRNYIIGDICARMKRMRGYNVLHPFGWDAFGLPAENAAIKTGTHPEVSTFDNIRHMKGQLQRLGISYAWGREIATCLPEYYKFNQWIFLKMFERGLAYRKRSTVNWCPVDNTVLANEQVVDGACWRCGTIVEQRSLEQWFFKITAYADELLAGLDTLSEWPEKVVVMQRNWIGRSEGARLKFPVADAAGVAIEVFTTRIDTIYGATFVCSPPSMRSWTDLRRKAPTPGRSTNGSRSFARSTRRRGAPAISTRKGSIPVVKRGIRSRARMYPSGSRTSCSPSTARAPSWPYPRMTNAISRSRGNTASRFASLSVRPRRRRLPPS